MEFILEARNVWYEGLLQARLSEMDSDRVQQINSVAEEAGAYAVVRVIDTLDGLSTPEPPSDFISSYGLIAFYAVLTSGRMVTDS